MPATSLSSIMLQVCSVIIIPRMIRVNEQTAHVVIVSCAIALVPGIFTHLKPELVKRRSQFLVAPSVVQNVQENGSNGSFRRDINGHWSDHSSSPSSEINPRLARTETRAKTGEPETERSSNETRPIYRDFSKISTFRPEFHYFLLSLSLSSPSSPIFPSIQFLSGIYEFTFLGSSDFSRTIRANPLRSTAWQRSTCSYYFCSISFLFVFRVYEGVITYAQKSADRNKESEVTHTLHAKTVPRLMRRCPPRYPAKMVSRREQEHDALIFMHFNVDGG